MYQSSFIVSNTSFNKYIALKIIIIQLHILTNNVLIFVLYQKAISGGIGQSQFWVLGTCSVARRKSFPLFFAIFLTYLIIFQSFIAPSVCTFKSHHQQQKLKKKPCLTLPSTHFSIIPRFWATILPIIFRILERMDPQFRFPIFKSQKNTMIQGISASKCNLAQRPQH